MTKCSSKYVGWSIVRQNLCWRILLLAFMAMTTACGQGFTLFEVAPSQFKLIQTKPGNSEVTAYWIKAPNVEKFLVEYRLKGTSTWSSFYAEKPPALVSGLTNNQDYEFRVTAQNNKGSSVSNIMVATPFSRNIAYIEQVASSLKDASSVGLNYKVEGQLAPPTDATSAITVGHGYKVFMNFAGIQESQAITPF